MYLLYNIYVIIIKAFMCFKLYHHIFWTFHVQGPDYNIKQLTSMYPTKYTINLYKRYIFLWVSGEIYLLIHYLVYRQ